MKLVLDASVAASWLLKRTDPGEARIAEDTVELAQHHGVKVPSIFHLELANALLTAERQRSSDSPATTKFLADLATIRITADPADPAIVQKSALNLARSLKLTTYDASYLELAIRTKSTLATFDRRLAEAARSAKIPLFGDDNQ